MRYFLLLLIPLIAFAFPGSNDKTEQIDFIESLNQSQVQISDNLVVTGDTTLSSTLTGPLKASSGAVTASNINLTSEVTGILPVSNGGTNSSTALNNNFVMISSGGAIVEDSSISTTELGYLDGVTSLIQGQIDGKLSLITTTEGDLIIGNASGDESRLPIGTTGYLLTSNGTTASWQAAPTSVSVTTKGDLQTYSTVPDRLPVGADGQVLVADSTESTGLKWDDPSSGGDFNYIENGTAETGTTGWTVYANTTAGDAPDDFGGTPSGGLTWTQNTTTPLFQDADFKLAKDAANRQGEGVYYQFTAYPGSLAKVHRALAMIDTSHANYDDDDIKVYLVSSSDSFVSDFNVIHPADTGLKAGVDLLKNFQFDATDTAYRLCIHIATTETTAFDVYFDEIKLREQVVAYGTPDVYLGQLTTTGSWSGTYTVDYYRKGNKLIADGRLLLDATPTGALQINLPSGYSIDTSVTQQDSSQSMNLGKASAFNGTSLFPTRTHYGTATQVQFRAYYAGGTYASHLDVNATVPFTWASGHYMYFTYEVPIQGWDSQARMSHESSTREIHGDVAIGSSATHPGGNVNVVVPFNTVFRDTIGSWNSTSYYFEIKESDTYDISAAVFVGTGTIGYSNIVIQDSSGSDIRNFNLAGNGSTSYGGSTTTYLEKGQRVLVKVYTQTSGSYQSAGNGNYLTIRRSANPQTIFDTETVAARYTSSAGTTTFTSGGTVIMDFENISYDTHAMCTTGASFKCTAKVSGKYEVCAAIASSTSTAASEFYAKLYKNGASYSVLDYDRHSGTGSTRYRTSGCDDIDLVKGDYVDVRVVQNTGSSLTPIASGEFNHITVKRIK